MAGSYPGWATLLSVSRALDAADINSALLALALSVAGVFWLFIRQRLHELESAVFLSAAHINEMRWEYYWGPVKYPDLDSRTKLEGGSTAWISYVDDALNSSDDTPSAPAHDLRTVLGIVASRYPFARGWQDRDASRAPTVDFGTLGDIDEWTTTMARLYENARWLVAARRAPIVALLDAGLPANLRSVGFSADGEFSQWLEFVARGFALSERVRLEHNNYKNYRSRVPRLKRILLILVPATVAFVAGVVLPLAWNDTPPAIYAWVPVLVYLLGLVALFVGVVRWHKEHF